MTKIVRPTLYGASDLTADLLRSARVLIDCHLSDTKEPWYGEVGETAYRIPEVLPVSNESCALVHTTYSSRLGISFDGYIIHYAPNPASVSPVKEFAPKFFHKSKSHDFWHGNVYMFGRDVLERDKLALRELLTSQESPFPITAQVDRRAIGFDLKFVISGFSFFTDDTDTCSIEQ